MAVTKKALASKNARIEGWVKTNHANILAYINALEADMKTGNVTGVIEKCNARTRRMDVVDLLGRELKPGEGTSLLTNAHNMCGPRTIAVANACAELLQNLRQTARTNCRYGTFAGPLAQAGEAKTKVREAANEISKITGIEKGWA